MASCGNWTEPKKQHACNCFKSHTKCHIREWMQGGGASIFSRFATKVKIRQCQEETKRKGPKGSSKANWSSMNLGGPCPMSCSTATAQIL